MSEGKSFTQCWSAGILPVWEAEASVPFFHFLFELLDTVQKGHHGVVELIVPEEPQATRTVERKFLNQHKPERKGRCAAWMGDFNSDKHAEPNNNANITFDLSVSDSKYEWFP